jgi:cystathionine beta-synthase
MTKFLDERWMRENGFAEEEWETRTIADLVRALPPKKLVVAASADPVGAVVQRMKERGISQVPVLDDGHLAGIVTETDLLTRLVEGRATPETRMAEVMTRDVETVALDEPLSALTALFARELVGLVVDGDGRLAGIVTKMDLLEWLSGPTRTRA